MEGILTINTRMTDFKSDLALADVVFPDASDRRGIYRNGAKRAIETLLVLLTSPVTLPLILPGVIAGAILCFAKAMGEFGATITFVAAIPGQTQTLPSAIYAFLQVPGGESSALRLVAISVAVAMSALILSEWVGRAIARRIGRA